MEILNSGSHDLALLGLCLSEGNVFTSQLLNDKIHNYRISANSFHGNYSFLNLALFTVTFDLYFINLNSCRGNYSREETIQGRKLFAEIRYVCYIQLVWENETYFHYLSERLQFLHFCGHPCLQQVEKFYLLF